MSVKYVILDGQQFAKTEEKLYVVPLIMLPLNFLRERSMELQLIFGVLESSALNSWLANAHSTTSVANKR
jgi:hypothetical protein